MIYSVKICEIDDTVHNQLILVLQDSLVPGVQRRAVIKDSWLQTVFNEEDILHIEGDWDQDVIHICDKSGVERNKNRGMDQVEKLQLMCIASFKKKLSGQFT